MQYFFPQGVAVLFSQAPGLGELRLLLEQQGFSIQAVEDSSEWPEMQGACVTLGTDFDAHAACWVDICDGPWPDDMDAEGEPTLVTSAHAMGAYGPFVHPGAFQRALQAPSYQRAAQGAQEHRAFVRVRLTRFFPTPEGGQETRTAPPEVTPAVELKFVLKVAAALAGLPGARFYFNPNSELILPIEALKRLQAMEPLPLMAVCRVQGYQVDERWALVDSVGMQQLGLRDHEFAWPDAAVSREEQVEFLIDFLHYHVDVGDNVHSGNTTDGPQGKRWRAEARETSCTLPPRRVLHWTMEGSPPEPPALAAVVEEPATAPAPAVPSASAQEAPASGDAAGNELESFFVEMAAKVEPWLKMRDTIRARALQWMRSPAFQASYYDDAHPPLMAEAVLKQALPRKEARETWQSLQVYGLQSPQLWGQYQQLAMHGQVLFAVPLMTNPDFREQPDDLLPCAVIVATSQRPQDILPASLFGEMAYEVYAGVEDAQKLPGTAKILENDQYRLFHREAFPLEETRGLHLVLYNILMRKSWMPPDDVPIIPLLVMPGPQGAFVQIPWHVASGSPPPLTGRQGKWAEVAEIEREEARMRVARAAKKGGCLGLKSFIAVAVFSGCIGLALKEGKKLGKPAGDSEQAAREPMSTVKSWSQSADVQAKAVAVRGEEYPPLLGEGLQGSGFLFKIEQGFILAATSRHQFDHPDKAPRLLADLEHLKATLDTEQLIRQPDSQIQLVTGLSGPAPCLEHKALDVLKDDDPLRLILDKGEWIDGTLDAPGGPLTLDMPSQVLRMRVRTSKKVSGSSGSPIVHADTGRVVGVMLGADKAEAPTVLEFETLRVKLRAK